MENFIRGTYRQTIFKAQDGYTIGLFHVKEVTEEEMKDFLNKTITITGYFPDIQEDEEYKLSGKLVVHPKYGRQYQVQIAERIKPEGKDGLISFLASGIFKGVGYRTAKSIVDYLGEDALEKILESYSNLLIIPRMTSRRALEIHNTLKEYEESHNTVIFLTNLGITMPFALKIYNHYKNLTKEIIFENPYQLIKDIEWFGFIHADLVAKNLGIEETDKRRIKAGISYFLLEECINTGHTYLTEKQLLSVIKRGFNSSLLTQEMIDIAIEELILEKELIKEELMYFYPSIYYAEVNVSEKIKRIIEESKGKKYPSKEKLKELIKEIEKESNIKYSKEQIESIIQSLKNPITIITGGPGTGKTTLVKAIIRSFLRLNKNSEEKIALLAPTGRAAKGMSEKTNFAATTIHRFLKWNKEKNEFIHNEYNQIDAKFVIVDEASMIDIWLLDSLLRALKDDVQIVFIGDVDQLPSVNPGEVLRDLIESGKLPVVLLSKIYRQSEDSTIVDLAHNIKNGVIPDDIFLKKKDRSFISTNDTNIEQVLEEIATNALKKGYDYFNIQVLSPMYKGLMGIDNINQKLQNIFNPKTPDSKELVVGDIVYRVNDKILQLVNMPEENVFNGDIGVLIDISKASENKDKTNYLYVDFNGNIVKYSQSDFINIRHAYAMSIHKAQGSEFDLVIMVLANSHVRMLERRLIYTGVSRAKEKLIMLGDKNAYLLAIKKEENTKRQTNLKTLITNLL